MLGEICRRSFSKPYFEPVKVKKTLRKYVDATWYSYGEQMSKFCMHRHTHFNVYRFWRYKIFSQQVQNTFSCSVQKMRRSKQPFLPSTTKKLQASAQTLKKQTVPQFYLSPLMTKPHPNAPLQWVTCSPAGQPICLQESRPDHKCIFKALVKAFT